MDALERLLAIEEIRLLKARYFRFVDTKAWDALVALFAPDATVEIPEASAEPYSAASLGDLLRAGYANCVTVHRGHMPEIEILDAENARAIWAMDDKRYFAPQDNPRFSAMIGSGHYHETYRRIGGAWRIASLKLTRLRLENRTQPYATGMARP